MAPRKFQLYVVSSTHVKDTDKLFLLIGEGIPLTELIMIKDDLLPNWKNWVFLGSLLKTAANDPPTWKSENINIGAMDVRCLITVKDGISSLIAAEGTLEGDIEGSCSMLLMNADDVISASAAR